MPKPIDWGPYTKETLIEELKNAINEGLSDQDFVAFVQSWMAEHGIEVITTDGDAL